MAKTAADENFPVGSWLIAKPLRPHIHAFYRFARAADDVADDPMLTPQAKLLRLDQMEQGLESLDPMLRPHGRDLLSAFRQDAQQDRMADWSALMAYCRLSAAPVGRMLLDLHGEDCELYPASDALCAALQVINHLQDCGDDYRRLNRIYLPQDMLQDETPLAAFAADPALRAVLDLVIDKTWPLLRQARDLKRLRSHRLRAEAGMIRGLAERLLRRLSLADPLAGPVKASLADKLAALADGLAWGLWA